MHIFSASLASAIILLPIIASAKEEVRTWGDWELRSNTSGDIVSCYLTWESWRYEIRAVYMPSAPLGIIDDLSIEPKMLGKRALNIYPREQPIQMRVRLDDEGYEKTYSFERILYSGLDSLDLLDSSIEFLSEWSKGEKITIFYRGDELVSFSQKGLADALDEFMKCRFEVSRR